MFGEIKIYIGSVIETKGNQVKVNILGTQTDFITYITNFSAFNQHFTPPIVGESVLVISFLESNLYLATSLPSSNTSYPINEELITYKDGTTLSYNTDSHTLKIDSKASINIACQSASIQSDEVDIECKNAKIKADSIDLGDSGGGGIVTTECIDPFTGAPFPQGSLKVRASL